MMFRPITVTLLLCAIVGADATMQRPAPIPIHVGALSRDGFVDVDHGVRDSVRDTQGELKKKKQLKVVPRPEDAVLHLYITRRYMGVTPAPSPSQSGPW